MLDDVDLFFARHSFNKKLLVQACCGEPTRACSVALARDMLCSSSGAVAHAQKKFIAALIQVTQPESRQGMLCSSTFDIKRATRC